MFTPRRIGFAIIVLIISYVILLNKPQILFKYKYYYNEFRVYSDREIPSNIEFVLKDVYSRVSKSELYTGSDKHFIFICNSQWRLTLFTRSPKAGGGVNMGISSNIFIRKSNIESNQIVSPIPGIPILLPEERPLSYFIAHEIIHKFQGKVNRFGNFTVPKYIIEGYADYIAKKPDFDFMTFTNNYLNKDFSMNPNSGLYNKYHLLVAFLIDVQGYTYKQIQSNKPDIEHTENELNKFIQKNIISNK